MAPVNLKSSIPTATDVVMRRQISFVTIGDVIPDRNNPRKHSRPQIRAIAKSIEAFGFNAPILIDRNRKIICRSWSLRSGNAPGHCAGPGHLP